MFWDLANLSKYADLVDKAIDWYNDLRNSSGGQHSGGGRYDKTGSSGNHHSGSGRRDSQPPYNLAEIAAIALAPEPSTTPVKQEYTTPSYTVPTAKSSEYTELLNKLTDLEARYAEATRVWSADEVAKHLDVDYNEQNILNELNRQTNEYYDAAVAEQQAIRNDYVKNNASYAQQVTDAYLDSNKYNAPTTTNKAIQAANMLATNMSTDATNSMNDYGMQQNIQNQEAYREAELAKNPSLAKQYYTGLGTELSKWSATKNTSDVQQYIDQLKSYTNMYAANRYNQAYLSQANAEKYAGLAGAAQNNAYSRAQAANSNVGHLQKMYEFYYNTHNKNSDIASNYVNGLLRSSTGH